MDVVNAGELTECLCDAHLKRGLHPWRAPASVRQNFAGNHVSDFALAYLEEVLKIKVHPRFQVIERKRTNPSIARAFVATAVRYAC